MSNKLFKQFRKYSKDRPEEKQEFAGILGLPVAAKTVLVPNRYGYVYVRLRNSNEIVQVFNDKVSAVYDLPVLLNWTGGVYKITSRDSKRYATWGASSPFLPEHSHYLAPSIAIQDEGLAVGTGTTLNFVGENVSVSMVGNTARILITDSGITALSGSANKELSNLNETAINTDLRPASNMTGTIGEEFLHWREGWFGDLLLRTQTGTSTPPFNTHKLWADTSGSVHSTVFGGGDGKLLTDAPSNGSLYGRKDGAWSVVTGSSGGSANPPITGSIVFQDEGVNQGSALILNVVGVNADVSISGSVARLFITGSVGGGGTPGGANGQLQYNNAGAFAGTKIEYYEEAGISQLQPANQTTTGSAGDEFYVNAANGNGSGGGGALRLNGGGMEGDVAGANNARINIYGRNNTENAGDVHIYGANTTGSAGGDVYLEPGYGTGTASYGMTKIVDPLSKYWGALVVENLSADKEYSFPDESGAVMLATHDHVGGDGAQIPTSGVADDAVTYAKIQNVSADKILGRATGTVGDVGEITCTAAARSVLDDTTVAAMLATLGGMGIAGGIFTGSIRAPGVLIDGGFLQLARSSKEISAGVITADCSFIGIDIEGATGTVDDLVTINGQSAGRLLIIQSTSNSRDITVKNTGNIKVPSDRVLDNINDKLFLIADNTNWYELVFANNG
jgi:hypothetical protein